MLEIIKSVRICDTFNLSLVYLISANCYEIQYSNDEKIIDINGEYTNKKDGLKAYNDYLKSLIKEVKNGK